MKTLFPETDASQVALVSSVAPATPRRSDTNRVLIVTTASEGF